MQIDIGLKQLRIEILLEVPNLLNDKSIAWRLLLIFFPVMLRVRVPELLRVGPRLRT